MSVQTMTVNPDAAALDVLEAAVAGCEGIGIFVHDRTLYLRAANEGEEFAIDLTHNGIVIWGRQYRALLQAAEAFHERHAVSIRGIAAVCYTEEPQTPPQPLTEAAPFVAETVAESAIQGDSGGDLTRQEFDMPRRTYPTRTLIDDVSIDPVPDYILEAAPDLEEGWE